VYICTSFSLCIHRLIDTEADSIAWLLWIVHLQTWLCRFLKCMLTYIPPDRCPGVLQQAHMAALFSFFLMNLQNYFHSGYTNLHSHQQRMRIPFCTSSPAFIVVCFLGECHSSWVRWSHSVVLICILFMSKDDEHFFMYLLIILLLLSKTVCLIHLGPETSIKLTPDVVC
jgi:hypothetical protein